MSVSRALRTRVSLHLPALQRIPLHLTAHYFTLRSLRDLLKDPAVELPWEVVVHLNILMIVFCNQSMCRVKLRISFAIGLANGMAALYEHTPPIQHRDLKSMNVLVTSVNECFFV